MTTTDTDPTPNLEDMVITLAFTMYDRAQYYGALIDHAIECDNCEPAEHLDAALEIQAAQAFADLVHAWIPQGVLGFTGASELRGVWS